MQEDTFELSTVTFNALAALLFEVITVGALFVKGTITVRAVPPLFCTFQGVYVRTVITAVDDFPLTIRQIGLHFQIFVPFNAHFLKTRCMFFGQVVTHGALTFNIRTALAYGAEDASHVNAYKV
jgi:hypothetical protein